MSGHLDIVQYLVAHGADVMLCSEDGTDCVGVAATDGHKDVIKFLIEANAAVDVRCSEDETTPLLVRDTERFAFLHAELPNCTWQQRILEDAGGIVVM